MRSTPPEIDAREIPHEVRMTTLLERFHGLPEGGELVFVAPHEPTPVLERLLATGGGAFTFGPVERGPGAWRWLVARVAGAASSPSAYLAWDHRRMEEEFERLGAQVEAAEWEKAYITACRYAVALSRHADIEDIVLFSACEALDGGTSGGVTPLLRQEHHVIRRGLDALTRAVRSRDAADVELLIANLQEIAVEHHGKEEEILFPAVDEAFSGDAASALTRRLMLG